MHTYNIKAKAHAPKGLRPDTLVPTEARLCRWDGVGAIHKSACPTLLGSWIDDGK